MDLNNLRLKGNVSKSLGSLTSLKTLSLDSNNLTGPLPTEFGNLINIVNLDLSHNNFSGEIPPSLLSLSNLTNLNLSSNLLTGSIPDNIGNLKSLQILNLSSNRLESRIPFTIGNLASLQILNLRNNLLTHPIPPLLENLINLVDIDLGSNLLNESAIDFSKLQKLKFLILDGNDLEGSFPKISNQSSLEKLYFGFNAFNSFLPSYLFELKNTSDVRLDGNSICDVTTRENITNQTVSQFLEKSCGCENINCTENGVLNVFLSREYRTCNCSIPIKVELLFSSFQFTVLTGEEVNKMMIRLVTRLDLSLSQVTLSTKNLTDNARQLRMIITIFPKNLSFSSESRLAIENIFQSENSLFAPDFGVFSYIGGSNSSAAKISPSPPPANPNLKSGSQGLKIWQILLICVGALLLISAISIILFFTFCRKVPVPPHQTETVSRQISEFELKVQEHFVRAIPLKEIETATNKFHSKNIIGSGSFGVIYRGVGSDQKEWAVKRGEHMTLETLQAFQSEVDVISKMSHRNLNRLLGFCSEKNEQMLVYEFIPKGTLRQNLDLVSIGDSEPRAPLSLSERLDIAIGTAQGLHYLHSFAKPTIIHRDVKSANILLDSDMQPKIADFGLLKQMNHDLGVEDNSKIAGTPGYLDPELSRAGKVTAKSDVYSFGVVLAELITGKPPVLVGHSPNEEEYKLTLAEWVLPLIESDDIESLVDPSLRGTYSEEVMRTLANVTELCLQKNAKDRPDMAEVAWRLAEIRSKLMPTNDVQSFESLMELSSGGRTVGGDETTSESIVLGMYTEMDIMRPPTAINGTGSGSYMLDEAALARADFFRPRRKDPLDFDSSSVSIQEPSRSMTRAR